MPILCPFKGPEVKRIEKLRNSQSAVKIFLFLYKKYIVWESKLSSHDGIDSDNTTYISVGKMILFSNVLEFCSLKNVVLRITFPTVWNTVSEKYSLINVRKCFHCQIFWHICIQPKLVHPEITLAISNPITQIDWIWKTNHIFLIFWPCWWYLEHEAAVFSSTRCLISCNLCSWKYLLEFWCG